MNTDVLRTRSTDHWHGVNVVALILSGIGILTRQPGLVVAGVVGVAFAAVARAGKPPTVDVEMERTLSEESPAPGDDVRVTVRVTNAGDSLLPDLRLVDGVPQALVVGDGSPRLGTALRPGMSATFEYTVTAARGVHRFEPTLVVARDASGAAERRVEVVHPTTLTCVPPLPQAVALPLHAQTTGIAGQVATRDGGPGVAFHAVREYRRGDPLNRIDWNRAARTGELSTVDFQRDRSATVVVLLDARAETYIAHDAHEETVLERSITAAGALFEGFLDTDDRVGVAVLSPSDGWLAPDTGETHRARTRELLATHPSLAPTPPTEPYFGTVQLRRLRRRLPTGAQVVFCSPLPDTYSTLVARRLDAHGHRVTVVSPDPTGRETAGQRLERIERSLRCSALRDAGIRVVDWGRGERLETAVGTATRRWSA